MSQSTSPNNVIDDDDVTRNLSEFGPLKHFCAVCFADSPLQRCSGCKLIYYCGSSCQRSNWSQHSVLCKDVDKRRKWCSAVGLAIDVFNSKVEREVSECKRALTGLCLLEDWSKSALTSIGFVKVLLTLILKEKYTTYNFPLLALVDLLRLKDGTSINDDLCFLFVYEEMGLVSMFKVLAQHAQLDFSQKLSTLRFLRLLAAHPKLQATISDQMHTLLPLISEAVENGNSTDVCSELGVFLSSILYSAPTPAQHGSMQSLYGESLNLIMWMNCAFGDSAWSADMEMGAVELLLGLLIDVDLFPDYDSLSIYGFARKKLLPDAILFKKFVFGFLDMLLIPKPVFQGAALHALHVLFSDSKVLDEVMLNMWLLSDLEIDGENEEEEGTGAESPLREMLSFFASNPVVELNFFSTHLHLNILHIFRYVLLSPYCTKHFIEATVGQRHLSDHLNHLEQRYLHAIGEAEKYKLTHRLTTTEKIGNQGEMEDVIQLINSVRNLLHAAREDIRVDRYSADEMDY